MELAEIVAAAVRGRRPALRRVALSSACNTLRIKAIALLLTLAAVVPLAGGCGGEEAAPPPVERMAREVGRHGADRVVVFVSSDGTEYVSTGGKSDPPADQRFRIGSVTKTFTAAIVLQLVEEGKLRLDDTLGKHLPGVVPGGVEITIRQLLGHRSGLVNFTNYAEFLAQASRSSSATPLDTLRFAASHPLDFAPGSKGAYSNTNYIALGLVIEKVTGNTYADELEERILDPLELERTELPAERRVTDLDDKGENPTVPWAAGALVSNAHDLSRFFSALLSGRLLSDESLAEMQVGLGLFPTRLSCGRFWGHDGGILDYATLVRASEEGDRIAVISVQGGVFGPPPDESELLCDEDAEG